MSAGITIGNKGLFASVINLVSRAMRVTEINQERYGAVTESLIDTTNQGIATYYYPSANGASMYGYKDLSLTGKFIDADGTVTMTVCAMNDTDLAAGDWIDITPAGYRADNNSTGNTSITVTNGTVTFAFDFDNLNYDRFRVKLVQAASATNTHIIKMRRKP